MCFNKLLPDMTWGHTEVSGKEWHGIHLELPLPHPGKMDECVCYSSLFNVLGTCTWIPAKKET